MPPHTYENHTQAQHPNRPMPTLCNGKRHPLPIENDISPNQPRTPSRHQPQTHTAPGLTMVQKTTPPTVGNPQQTAT